MTRHTMLHTQMRTHLTLHPLDCSFSLLPCSVSQSVCPTKLLNITIHRSQRNLQEFQSSVILQPSCSSWLGTVPGMPPPAVLHTSRSCSCKFQGAQIGFDAQCARECLRVCACTCVVCAQPCIFVWTLTGNQRRYWSVAIPAGAQRADCIICQSVRRALQP